MVVTFYCRFISGKWLIARILDLVLLTPVCCDTRQCVVTYFFSNIRSSPLNEPHSHSIFAVDMIIISFMQGIYTYIPETNHVPREYSVAANLSLLFMVPISLVPALALLYFYVSTF